jgi:hypothetical protein
MKSKEGVEKIKNSSETSLIVLLNDFFKDNETNAQLSLYENRKKFKV